MALEAMVDSLDTVPEALKGEYKAVAEGDNKGRFVLDVNVVNGYALENVDSLKSSYAATKGQLETATSALNGYNGLKLKPSEIASKMKRLDDLEKFDPETEADKRAAAKLHSFQTTLTTEFEGKLNEADAKSSKLQSQVEKLLVNNALQEALTKHGGVSALLTPILAGRVKVREDDSGQLTTHVLDEKGNTDMTIKDGRVEASTIEDLVLKFKADATYGVAFAGSGKSGGGTPPKNNGGGGSTGSQTYSKADWIVKTGRATSAERTALFQEAAAGRITVTD